MKKNFWLAGLLALGMMGFQSCDEVGGGIGTGGDEPGGDPGLGSKMEELAPNAQKTRLQDAGLEFINNIKAGDHENLVDVIGYIDENLDYGIDTAYVGKLEKLYEETYEGDNQSVVEGYYGSPIAAVRNLMAISLDAAQSGAQLSEQTTNIWTQTFSAGMPDIYGRLTPNQETEEWEWDSSVTDRLEVSFTDDHDQKWVATLKGSKETTQAKLTIRYKWIEENYYVDGPDAGKSHTTDNKDSYDYMVDVPKEITFAVTCNNVSIIDLTLNSSVAIEGSYKDEGEQFDKYYWQEYTYGHWEEVWKEYYDEFGELVGEWVEEWVVDYAYGWYNSNWEENERNYVYDFKVDYTNLNADAKLKVNAYEETFKTEVTKQGIEASASVTVNGQSMLKGGATLKADVEGIINLIENSANEELDYNEITIDENLIKEMSMYVDVMGKVQIVGKCDKFKDLFDALVDLEEADDEDDFVKYQRCLDVVNKTYNVTLHYDNTETVQANLEFEAYEEEDEWDPSYTWFDVRPIIVFAIDDSKYGFEDYFTESSFSDLIDEVEDLGEDFEKMFDRYFEVEEDNWVEMEPNLPMDHPDYETR